MLTVTLDFNIYLIFAVNAFLDLNIGLISFYLCTLEEYGWLAKDKKKSAISVL